MDTVKEAGQHASYSADLGRITVVRALGQYGQLNDNELARYTGWRLNSICKRRLEAQHLGWVKHVWDGMGEPVTRHTETGCPGYVWELSPDGKKLLASI